jgi:hypothetical protein
MNQQELLQQYMQMHGPLIGEPSKQIPLDFDKTPNPELGIDFKYVFQDGTTLGVRVDKDGSATQSSYNPSAEYIKRARGDTSDDSLRREALEETKRTHQQSEADRQENINARKASDEETRRRNRVEEGRAERGEARADRQEERQTYVDYINSVKARAEAETQRLNQLIAQQRMTSEQAKEEYSRWMDQNVVVPLKLSEEARARNTESRSIEMEQRRRAEAAAKEEFEVSKWGYDQGQEAIANELKLLPYAVGPAFAEQFSGALKNLAKGKGYGGFTADAFRIQKPDFQGIAERETARALASISPYAERLASAYGNESVMGQTPQATDYSQLTPPSGAPALPAIADFSKLMGETTLPPVLPAQPYPSATGGTSDIPYTDYVPGRTIMDEISTDPYQ